MISEALSGLVSGGAYAAIAVCLVLMYQMLGVLNFAQAAIGAMAACASLFAYKTLGLGTLPSVLVALGCGAALGALIGLVMARFFLETSVERRSLVTIAFMVGLIALGNRILNGSAYNFPSLFSGKGVEILGTGVPKGTLIEVGGSILLAILVQIFLRSTHVGAQLRATSERPITAELLGIRVHTLTVAVWAAAGLISTMAILFVLPTSTTSFPPLSYIVIFSLGAALLGLLRNMTVAAVGGIVIGMAQSIVQVQSGSISRYSEAVPFVIIVVVMVWWRRSDVWSEAR